jgi:hypothetical protein
MRVELKIFAPVTGSSPLTARASLGLVSKHVVSLPELASWWKIKEKKRG